MGWFTNLVVVMACVAAGLVLYPVQITQPGDVGKKGSPGETSVGLSGFIRLLHLLSFSTAFGTALWASFIGGIIMYKHLPRHQFGNLQAQLFPAYFKLLAVCSSICVASVATMHPWATATRRERMQVAALGMSLFTVLLNLLYFQPLTIKVMRERHKVEENVGQEPGWAKNVEAAKRNPELTKLNKKFGMIHGMSSLSNLFCFGGFAFHSW